jgi:carbonic anhydrase
MGSSLEESGVGGRLTFSDMNTNLARSPELFANPPLRALGHCCVIASLGLAALGARAAAPHWTYVGEDGPKHWAELDHGFEACAKGTRQSPIDISKTVKVDLPKLDFQYTETTASLVNNGHTIQVNLPPGQKLTVGDKTFELLQFHFHTPSEETINGKHAAMVAHFVHKSASGELGVVAALIQPGKFNAAFAPVFAHLPRTGETVTVEGLALDLLSILPADKGYYAFDGSLTTPPCTEGVNWMVLKKPIVLGKAQIDAFRKMYRIDARPTQPLNGREIKESL